MNLENSVKSVIEEKLNDGTVERIIAEKFEKGLDDAIGNLFRTYGDINELIKDKVKAVLVPSIENRDFSDYVVKLDDVLTKIVNSTVLVDNKTLLSNFKELMVEDERKKVIKVSEIFTQWCEYVAEKVDTDGLKVDYDDEPSYEYVNVTMVVEHEEGRTWSDFERANIIFECEHDEKMNFIIPISRWKKYDADKWSIDLVTSPVITNLKYMSSFEVFMLKLNRMLTKIELDEEEIEEDIKPEAQPEVSWS